MKVTIWNTPTLMPCPNATVAVSIQPPEIFCGSAPKPSSKPFSMMMERPKVTRMTSSTFSPTTRCNKNRCSTKPTRNATGSTISVASTGLRPSSDVSISSAKQTSTMKSPCAMLTKRITPADSDSPIANNV